MNDWEKSKIIENYKTMKAREKKEFMIAYASLDEKYHGYLEALPLNEELWYKSLDDKDLDTIKKELSDYRIYNSKKGRLMLGNITKPYLNIDGILAMASDEHKKADKKYDVSMRLIDSEEAKIIKVIVDSELYGTRVGLAIVSKDYSGEMAYEKAISTAIRKALNYLGYGRFPTASTPFGEDKMIQNFREFIKGKK